jgi:hypothetical protein
MADHGKRGGGLNGAYYGPAIPPPDDRHASRSIGRGGSCCCNPCSLLCALFKLIVSIVIVLGIIVLVLWLVFRPNELKSHAESATLTRFDLDNNTLFYNLDVEISIRNPNKRVAFYYDRVQATASYDGTRIAFDGGLPTFFQDHKNTTTINPSFEGQKVVPAGDSGSSLAATYNSDKSDGFFDVDVRVDMKVRFKVWFIKTNKYSPKIKCSLKLPAPASSGASSGSFSRTKCDVDFI